MCQVFASVCVCQKDESASLLLVLTLPLYSLCLLPAKHKHTHHTSHANTALKPGEPLELCEPEGPVSDDFTVVLAGGSGVNGDALRRRDMDGGSSSRPGGSDGSSSSDSPAKSWVLASGGFEDADSAGSNN